MRACVLRKEREREREREKGSEEEKSLAFPPSFGALLCVRVCVSYDHKNLLYPVNNINFMLPDSNMDDAHNLHMLILRPHAGQPQP